MTCIDIVCISAEEIAEMQTKTKRTLVVLRNHTPINLLLDLERLFLNTCD